MQATTARMHAHKHFPSPRLISQWSPLRLLMYVFAFSAPILLSGGQEGHLVRKKILHWQYTKVQWKTYKVPSLTW